MDAQTEQAIWRRVQGGPVRAEEALLPERLEALLTEQRADAASLQALSQRLRGRWSQALARQAALAGERARELTTLHYLLTGRRLRLPPPKPPALGPTEEALRQACLRARQSERSFRALAEEFRDYGDDFAAHEAAERELARVLQGALQFRLQTQQKNPNREK